jgi:hypothetical protein
MINTQWLNPQSESHLLSHPPAPQSPNSRPKSPRRPGLLAFRTTGPPNPYSKTHTLWPGAPNARGKTHTLWPGAPNPHGKTYTFTPIPLQYGLRCSPDSHNMASIQPKTAQHDLKWLSDSKRCPQDSPRWPEDSPRWTLVLVLSINQY